MYKSTGETSQGLNQICFKVNINIFFNFYPFFLNIIIVIS